jgi:hypothetical protein
MAKFTPALVLVVCLVSLDATRAQDMAKPLGKWERKIGKNHVTLIVEENRLHVMNLGEKPCTLHADYHMTKDGVIYGVVTSIECDDDEDDNNSDKLMIDAPFSCRFRIDEGALLIRDLRTGAGDNKEEAWNGRFKAVIPTAAQTSTAYPVPATAGRLVPCPSPSTSAGKPATDTVRNEQTFNFPSGLSR